MIASKHRDRRSRDRNITIATAALQRRQVTVILALIDCGLIAGARPGMSRSRRLLRQSFVFEHLVSTLTDRMFRRMYRMPRAMYYLLLYKLIAHDKEHTRAILATRLSMTIRWLAAGSYLDICVTHNVAVSSFFANFDAIIESINEFLVFRFHPADTDENKWQSKEFGRGVSSLSGCVGAIDGLTVRISEPRGAEIANTSTYYNRKGFLAIVV
jgi:hypothetical protein